jgi:hypothetical protein
MGGEGDVDTLLLALLGDDDEGTLEDEQVM